MASEDDAAGKNPLEEKLESLIQKDLDNDRLAEEICKAWSEILWIDGLNDGPEDTSRNLAVEALQAGQTDMTRNIRRNSSEISSLRKRARDIRQEQEKLREDVKQSALKPMVEMVKSLDGFGSRGLKIEQRRGELEIEWNLLRNKMKQPGKRKREDNPDIEQQAFETPQTQGGHDHDPDLQFFTYSTNKYDLFERAAEQESVPALPAPKNLCNQSDINVLLVFMKDLRGENMHLQGYLYVTCNLSGDSDLLVKRWQKSRVGIPIPLKYTPEGMGNCERSKGIELCNMVDKTWRSSIGH